MSFNTNRSAPKSHTLFQKSQIADSQRNKENEKTRMEFPRALVLDSVRVSTQLLFRQKGNSFLFHHRTFSNLGKMLFLSHN
jgi:hypothetical protein